MSDVDNVVARADEAIGRSRANRLGAFDDAASARARKRREAEIMTRVGRILAVDAAIIVAAVAVGLFLPLGMFGFLAVVTLLIAATALLAFAPLTTEVRPERFDGVPLKALPHQTITWLDHKRPALPAPAVTLVDTIGVRLETLAPQLATLDEGEPIAAEIRKLVGEQIPALVKGYEAVPKTLRTVPRNGRSPDEQLVDGLKVIEGEIAELSSGLAQGDLDRLSTRERYLQIRYRDEDGPA